MLADTYRRRLFEFALDHYGYVSTANAHSLGVPPVELRKLASRGGLSRVAYGVYRFDTIPRCPMDQFMEAVLRVGPDAHLTGDAVLALHDLAQVNPRKIRVGARRRARPTLPATVEFVRDDVADDELTTYEGIPSVRLSRAIADCRGRVMTTRLVDAVQEAERRGLLLRAEATALCAQLEAET